MLFLGMHAIGSIASPILRFARLWPGFGEMLCASVVQIGQDHSQHGNANEKERSSITFGLDPEKYTVGVGIFADYITVGKMARADIMPYSLKVTAKLFLRLGLIEAHVGQKMDDGVDVLHIMDDGVVAIFQ
mmetsp:Transcript_41637/g.69270  ORF Transcript_41637/g.69270 Transcript_41637/m.69270 type:complete len:131 (-) Transcript_41637:398-790(-)